MAGHAHTVACEEWGGGRGGRGCSTVVRVPLELLPWAVAVRAVRAGLRLASLPHVLGCCIVAHRGSELVGLVLYRQRSAGLLCKDL